MPIRDDNDLAQANEALGNLYRALAALRREVPPSNQAAFDLLAEGPLEDIRRLREEIDAYTGTTEGWAHQATLWLRLAGGRAQWPDTPASVLTAFLDALRKGVQTIATFHAYGRRQGRPPTELQHACDFHLLAFQPGSLRVGMRLPEPRQGELFDHGLQRFAEKGLSEFLDAALWVMLSGDPSQLALEFAEPPQRRVMLRALRPFIPRKQGGVSYVELYGKAVPGGKVVHLSSDALPRVKRALDTAVAATEERYEGEVREMDLDRKSFKLRNVINVGEVPCRFEEAIAPIAASLLGKRVQVIGTRQIAAGTPQGPLIASEIEELTPDDG